MSPHYDPAIKRRYHTRLINSRYSQQWQLAAIFIFWNVASKYGNVINNFTIIYLQWKSEECSIAANDAIGSIECAFLFLQWSNLFQVKIWFQNHRYKCKRQAKEKAMAEQNQHNQVSYINYNKPRTSTKSIINKRVKWYR